MRDIVYSLQALTPTTEDMMGWVAAETIEEACGEILKLRGLLTEARRERDAAADEIERLRDLFRVDGKQHANHIKSLTKAHVGRVTKYADEIERLRREVQEARAALVAVWNDAIEAASDRISIAHNECCDPARYDRGDCCGRFIPVQAAIRELKDRAP